MQETAPFDLMLYTIKTSDWLPTGFPENRGSHRPGACDPQYPDAHYLWAMEKK